MPAPGIEARQSASGLDFKLHPVRPLHGRRRKTKSCNFSVGQKCPNVDSHMRMQLVVINISDHLLRIRANGLDRFQGSDRVLGCLLGQQHGRVVDISNSFEIKYSMGSHGIQIDDAFLVKKQEQCKIASPESLPVCLDHSMLAPKQGHTCADKQTFASLDIVGWYATGKSVSNAEMAIHRKVRIGSSQLKLIHDQLGHAASGISCCAYISCRFQSTMNHQSFFSLILYSKQLRRIYLSPCMRVVSSFTAYHSVLQ